PQTSSSASSTLAAWPSAFTEYQARCTLPVGPMRKVERMVPTVFLPYMTFLSASVSSGNFSLYLVRNLTWLSALLGEMPSTATPAFSKVLRLSLNWHASLVQPGVSSFG